MTLYRLPDRIGDRKKRIERYAKVLAKPYPMPLHEYVLVVDKTGKPMDEQPNPRWVLREVLSDEL